MFDAWLHLTHQALVDSISQVAEDTAIQAPPPPHLAQQPKQAADVPEFMRQWPARTIAPIPPKEAPNTRASRKDDLGYLTMTPPTPKAQQASVRPPLSITTTPVKAVTAGTVDPKQEMPSPSGGEIKVHIW